MAITDLLQKIPAYNYVVGQKTPSGGSTGGFPVKIMIDPDFKKTIITSVSILSLGIAVAGIAIAYRKRRGK